MRKVCVNPDPRNVANHPDKLDGLEYLVGGMQWVNAVGDFAMPPNYLSVKTRAIQNCNAREIHFDITCNMQFAFMSSSEGRFPAQGILASEMPDDMLGPPEEYKHGGKTPTDANGEPYPDIRRRVLLEREDVRELWASKIATAYRSKSGLFLDGCYNDGICGGPVRFADMCDTIARIRDKIDDDRKLGINCAGTAQLFTRDDWTRLIGAGVDRVTFEQWFIERPGNGAPKQDIATLKQMAEFIDACHAFGPLDVIFITTATADPIELWAARTLATIGSAIVSVTI